MVMRSLVLGALLVAPVALAAQSARAVPEPVPCLVERATYTRDYIVHLMVREDSASANSLHIYRLPRTSPDSVVAVTDPAECTRVAAAYYADVAGLLPEHGIGVVRVGTFTMAEGALRAGEWRIVKVFDARMRVVARIAQ